MITHLVRDSDGQSGRTTGKDLYSYCGAKMGYAGRTSGSPVDAWAVLAWYTTVANGITWCPGCLDAVPPLEMLAATDLGGEL